MGNSQIFSCNVFPNPQTIRKKISLCSAEKELIHFQTALVCAMHFSVVKQFSIFLFYEDKQFSKIKCFGWCFNLLNKSWSPFLVVSISSRRINGCRSMWVSFRWRSARSLSSSVVCGSPPLLACGPFWCVILNSLSSGLEFPSTLSWFIPWCHIE